MPAIAATMVTAASDVVSWLTILPTNMSPCDAAAAAADAAPTPAEPSSLQQFSTWYESIHGYLSVFVCLFGIISNTMNIVVLTQREMLTSTNVILTSLAVADMLTMMSYLPYAVYYHCLYRPDPLLGHSAGWVAYLIFNMNFVMTTHTVAMWFTVLLAVFRYIVVSYPLNGPSICTIPNAKVIMAIIVVLSVLFSIPNYVMYAVGTYVDDKGCERDVTWTVTRDFVTLAYQNFNFWLYAVLLKMAPCVLLSVLSALLVRAMRQADSKRRRLKKAKNLGTTGSARAKEYDERAAEHQRTTAMLVAVVLTFVAVELPNGIVAFLSGVDSTIFTDIYIPLGDVWDELVLINSAVNFVLYCTMSRQFRATFSALFLRSSCACVKMTSSSTSSSTRRGGNYSTLNDVTDTMVLTPRSMAARPTQV
jgi:thyrotropin-releasing hormone receptor